MTNDVQNSNIFQNLLQKIRLYKKNTGLKVSSIDYFILFSILLITLFVGLYAGRNIKNIKSFAIGAQKYGFFAVFATLSASYIGGGYTFGISEKVFQFGIVSAFCLFGFSIQQILVSQFIVPRISSYRHAISAGDIMENFYGKWGRILTGFTGALVCMGITGAQVSATGYVFQLFIGIDQATGILIGCGIVLIYAVFGGIKAVVATDILQFCILIIAIPLAFLYGYLYVGNLDNLIHSIPSTHLSFPGTLSWIEIISLSLSLLLGEALVPPYIQRLFIGKNTKVTRRSILASGIMSIPFFLLAGGIGLIALSIQPDLNPHMSLPFVVNTVLPVGLRGFAIAGIICVIMSSADSFLNASAISIVHDIIKPLKKNKLSSKNELSLTRLATLIIGVGAIAFALCIKSVLDILLYSYMFWAPIILIPFVFGLFGRKISLKQLLCTSVAGSLSVIIWNIFFKNTDIDGLIIGVFFNFIVFAYFLFANVQREKIL